MEDLEGKAMRMKGILMEGSHVPEGRLFGLPELPGKDCWVDMAGVVALTECKAKTITGWLNRGGPRQNPFPFPDKFLYRLYWKKSDVTEWIRRNDQNQTG
ncbi:hypothetical protein [Nocardiopsis flavescens]